MERRRIILGGLGPSRGFITQHPVPNIITYDGQEHELCTAGSGSGTMLYSKDGVSFSSSIPTEINAGTYTVYYKADASTSHTESSVYQISCTIDKAAGSVSIAPTNKSVTYNGTAQDIVNAGSGTGTMYYRVGDSGDFSTTIPKQTNANDSYTVYYYAAESSNYTQSTTGSVTATIGQREVTLTWGTVTWTYDGKTHSTTCTAGNVCSGDSCTVTLTGNSVGANAGTATVTASSLSNSNYTLPSSKTATLTINKATGGATVSGVSLTYNTSSRSLITVTNNTGTMHYRVGTSGSWTTTTPTATNVGSWTIYYYMDASTNYTARGSSSSPWSYVSSSIGKANQSAPTATGKTTTYPTTATATASGGGGQGTLTWTNGNSQTSVGSKKTKAYWAGNGNYNASPYSNEVTVQMNKAAGSVRTAPTAKNPSYNGSAQALINAGASDTGTMQYSLSSSSGFSSSIPTATNAGSYTVYYYAAASTNYNQSSTGSVTSTISYVEGFAPSTYSTSITYSRSSLPPSGNSAIGPINFPENTFVCYYSRNNNYMSLYPKYSELKFISGVDVIGSGGGNLNMYGSMKKRGAAGSLYKFTNEYIGTSITLHNTQTLQKGTGVYSMTVMLNSTSLTCTVNITITIT